MKKGLAFPEVSFGSFVHRDEAGDQRIARRASSVGFSFRESLLDGMPSGLAPPAVAEEEAVRDVEPVSLAGNPTAQPGSEEGQCRPTFESKQALSKIRVTSICLGQRPKRPHPMGIQSLRRSH